MKFRRRLTYKDFKRYFSNKLKPREKHAFEKRMMQDAFDAEAYDGLSQFDKQQLDADISALKKGITRRTKNSRLLVPYWFRYAATVLLLIGIGVGFYILEEPFKREKVVSRAVTDSSYKQEDKASDGKIVHKESFGEKPSGQQATKKVEKDHVALDAQTESQQTESEAEEQHRSKTQQGITVVAPQVAAPEKQRTLEKQIEKPSANQAPQMAATQKQARQVETLAVEPVEIQRISTEAIAVHPDERFVGLDVSSARDSKEQKQDTHVMADQLAVREQSAGNRIQVSQTGSTNQSSLKAKSVLSELGALPPGDMTVNQYKQAVLKRINDSALSAFPGEHHITIAFKVNGQGMLSGFQFDPLPDSVFVREIQTAIEAMSPWIPGTKDGDTITSRQQIKLKIVVEE